MTTGFVATELSITEENGVLVTVLSAPSSEEDDFYLMLQHKELYTKQDHKLGMDKPYIEYCGQGYSWYGHIDKFELLQDRVNVKMDKEAASHMSNDGSFEVIFSLNHVEFDQLRNALRKTFRDSSFFIEQV